MKRLISHLVLFSAVGSLPATAENIGPPEPPWHELTMTASKLFVSAKTSIKVETGLPHPDALDGSFWRIDVDSKVLGRHSRSSVWFDPSDALAVMRTKRRFGSKSYQKIYRFSSEGIHSQRRSPKDPAELELPPEDWTGGFEQTFPVPEVAAQRCQVVSEPTTLLAVVPLRGHQQDLELCVFSSRSWHLVKTRRIRTSTVEPRFTLTRAGDENESTTDRIAGELTLVEVEISGEPLDQESSEPLELLGLEGNIVMSIDPERRLPVEVRGRMPVLGDVRVRLETAVLR